MKERIAESFFWLVLPRGGVQLLSFFSTLLVARLLTPADYGVMALANVWTSSFALISEMGLGAAIIQFRDLEDRELNTCFWLMISLACFGYGLLFMAAPAIAGWFASPALENVLRGVGIALPLIAIRVVPDSLLRKAVRLDKVSQAEMIASLIVIPVTLGLAWQGAGVWALVVAAILMPLIHSVCVFWFVQWWPGWAVGGTRFKALIDFSLSTVGSRLCWAFYEQADTVVLGKFVGQSALGAYAMAKELALLPVNKVATVINHLATPIMAELQADREALAVSILRSVRLVAWVTFPLCIGFGLVAEDLVRVILTEKWIAAVPLIQVLSGYALFRSIAVLWPPVLLARYRARFLFYYNLTLLGTMPVAFWIAATGFGAIGVALMWLIVYPFFFARLVAESLREVSVSWQQLWSQLRSPLEATLAMILGVEGVRLWTASWGPEFALSHLLVLSFSGAIVYAVIFLIRGGKTRQEVQAVAGWVFRHGLPVEASDSET